MNPLTHTAHRLAATVLIAVALLAGCTSAGDAAAQVVTSYITSHAGPGDGGTWCDHDWKLRTNVAQCKTIPAWNNLTVAPVVRRTFAGPKIQGMDSQVVVVQVGYAGNATRPYGIVVVSFQGQLYVERESELRATINLDDNRTVLTELGL